jgi:hypothetical protein
VKRFRFLTSALMIGLLLVAGGPATAVVGPAGSVTGWGWDDFGQATAPALTDIVAIAAGGVHSLALHSDGTVTAWGLDSFGQTAVPSGLTDVVAIAAGYFHSLALN